MFGIGFTELLLIAIIAILFLGPDKLPQTMVEIAKFIKSIKKTISDAKSSLDEEMKIAQLKEEAESYKQQLDNATSELKNFKNINFDDFDDVSYDKEVSSKSAKELATPEAPKDESQIEETPSIEPKKETITFKKPTKPNPKGDA